ncbi:DUF4980 domain-containing protein [Muribaculaceae bacterium Isolate-002 (NCI)]|nr:DUF4980 domain-containing protein [Muribaculaceae bacterium Isolate-002 (NCI)]
MPAADGIDISHLGTNNTLVRVTDGNSRYVLFPVEESVDDATLNLLLDGKQEKTLRIRLARNRVDYYVPFDISAYKDSKIIFDVVTTQGRASVREASDDACWKNIRLSDTFDTSNTEKYRPAFHHTPLYGWMNDPNGMFYKDGVWHLYYQYNPYGSKWQNMSWGHSTSTDLVNWEHHPVAIEPNSLGQVFSGSCVVDSDNTAGFGKDAVIALYTSAGINQMQSLAYSTDNGETFTIYPGNPIITLESEARDPNMFWNDETKEWNLLLAHALDHEMLIFTSPDLKEWTLQSAFGKGLGAQGGVWECPDMRHLPVEGTDESKWVLICNLNPGGPFGGSAAQYFTGDFDGRKFTADTDSEGNVPTKWMDYGKDHYATVSWSGAPDGRNVVIGWMSNWQYAAEVPTHQYRSANTLPRDISLFKGTDGQYYLKTVPSPELLALRDHRTVSAKGKSFGKSPVKFALPEANDGICEINMSLNARKADKVTITLANRQGEKVDMTFDPSASTFSFDRTQSGLTDFSHDFPAVVTAPTLRNSTSQSLRIFVDRSSIEVFDGEGNFVLTNLVFPGSPYTTLSLAADGGKASLNSLEIYTIKTSNK